MQLLSATTRMKSMITQPVLRLLTAIAVLSLIVTTAPPAYADSMLKDFHYPYSVKSFEFSSQGLKLNMAYMDVPAKGEPKNQTVVMFHGKNFCGATWEKTIQIVAEAGYRVIIPDQIGFCRSSKPRNYHYSLFELASNTHALLKHLGIKKPAVMGHSMGGMLAMRYAIAFPDQVGKLILLNPIGLEDWRAKGVPEATIDQLYQGQKKVDAASIKAYQEQIYYHGEWKPEYDRWVDMLASMYSGKRGDDVAWAQALTSQTVFSDPVIHEIEQITAPTVLMIGELDTTAIGRNRADKKLAAKLGNYPALARAFVERLQSGRLVAWPDLGHSPHIEAPEKFHGALMDALAGYSASAKEDKQKAE